MRITHFVENLNRGGLERVVIDLVLAQQNEGHSVGVICLHEPGVLAPELTGRGVPVVACGKRRGVDLRAIARARGVMRAHGTDVLHSHNIIAHDHAVLAALGLPLRRTINTRHGIAGPPRSSARAWLYRRTMRRTDHVAAVCDAARDILVSDGGLPAAKVVAIPNGIHVDHFEPANAAAHARLAAMLGVRESTRIAGFVGRLNWAKDIPTLIRAFARVAADRADVVLALIGDGALRAELAAVAATEGVGARVHFLGDRSDVRELLQGFDVFAMSSVSEGYSIALLEASAAALPIVATDVGGNAEIVADGVNGRIVPPRDPERFADALSELLSDATRARAMGRAGREWVERHGSFQGMVARYDALYRGEAGRT